jgi:hypothetical protein
MLLSWDSLITCYIMFFVADSIVSYAFCLLQLNVIIASMHQHHHMHCTQNGPPTKIASVFWRYSSSCLVLVIADISSIFISILRIFRQQSRSGLYQ